MLDLVHGVWQPAPRRLGPREPASGKREGRPTASQPADQAARVRRAAARAAPGRLGSAAARSPRWSPISVRRTRPLVSGMEKGLRVPPDRTPAPRTRGQGSRWPARPSPCWKPVAVTRMPNTVSSMPRPHQALPDKIAAPPTAKMGSCSPARRSRSWRRIVARAMPGAGSATAARRGAPLARTPALGTRRMGLG